MGLQSDWVSMAVVWWSLRSWNPVVCCTLILWGMSWVLIRVMIVCLAMTHTLAVTVRMRVLRGDSSIQSWWSCIAQWALQRRCILSIRLHRIIHEVILLRQWHLIPAVSRRWKRRIYLDISKLIEGAFMLAEVVPMIGRLVRSVSLAMSR